MRKRIFVHGGWAFAALAAFGLGSVLSEKGGAKRDGSQAGTPGGQASASGDIAGGKAASQRLVSALGERGQDRIGVGGRTLSERDIHKLGRTVRTATSPVERRLAFTELLEELTAENALLIRENLLGIDTSSKEWRDFHYAWGAIAGSEAVIHGMESPERDMEVTLSGWASADPAAALDWFDSLPPEKRAGNSELQTGMTRGLADTNPTTAFDFVYDMAAAGSNNTIHLLNDVTQRVVRYEGAAAAAAWTESLQPGRLQEHAIDRVADTFVDHDRAAAMRWAENLGQGPGSARAIEEVAEEISKREPDVAIAWLESLPPSDGRTQGYRSSFLRYARRDTSNASIRAAGIADTVERNAALTGVAMAAGNRNEAEAFAFIGLISEPSARVEAVRRSAPQFSRISDPSSAMAWIDQRFPEPADRFYDDGSPGSEVVAVLSRNDSGVSRAAALEWLETLPPAEANSRFIEVQQ